MLMMSESDTSRFCIKAGYCHRSVIAHSDSHPHFVADLIRQPDAYSLAEVLAGHFGGATIVEIGCRSGRLLAAARFGPGRNLKHHRRHLFDEDWIDANLNAQSHLGISDNTMSRSIVICAGVIERLPDPTHLLTLLSRVSRLAQAVIITTPERDLIRGRNDMGPPADVDHVREWSMVEFEELLTTHDCEPTLIGLTVSDNRSLNKNTIVAVIDHSHFGDGRCVPDDFRPLALLATYNDVDIAPQVTARLLDDGIGVHVLDNWSTDGTFEAILELAATRSGLLVERFPDRGTTRYFEWSAILRRKEEIAAKYPGRWIIHHDSDEVRCPPWRDVSLRAGLHIVEHMGFSAVDFTVCEFRPVDDRFSIGMNPETQIRHFEFGRRRDHFLQVKAWRQPAQRVDLTCSGGHDVQFAGRRVFPYKFVTKHYSLRSSEQARRKIFMERKERFCPTERAMGWHVQYNGFETDHPLTWNASELIEFDEHDTRRHFLTELIAGIGITR
jgi:hypothetical protein